MHDVAAVLAGFALAHAAWSASDLPAGELVVPLAFVQRGQARELVRFEAATQEEAVLNGKAAMSKATVDSDAWAFAREGLFPRDGKKVDVLVVDCWSSGMSSPITFIQQFEPFAAKQRCRIVGEPLLVVEGIIQTPKAAQTAIKRLRDGIRSHPKAGALWSSWQ
jgi:hypothetical protein